jgi:hypothetical protein
MAVTDGAGFWFSGRLMLWRQFRFAIVENKLRSEN